jgi:hypothetical protein
VVISEGGDFTELCADVFGPGLEHMRVAHLATANGAALELFEFVSPRHERRADNFQYWRGGIFHFCVVDPDIEGLVARIAATGGRQRSRIWTIFEGQPYRAAYCEDPYGNILEVLTHSHEQTFSNQ